MEPKEKAQFGIAIIALLGIFAIFLVALLKPDGLTPEGGMVVAACITFGILILNYFFRKAPEIMSNVLAKRRVKALSKQLADLTKKGGGDIAG